MEEVNLWIKMNAYAPLPNLPRITEYFHSAVGTPAYYSSGRERKGQTHSIFHYTLRGQGETWRGSNRYFTEPGVGFLHVIEDDEGGYCYPREETGVWEFLVFCFDGGGVSRAVADLVAERGPLCPLGEKRHLVEELGRTIEADPGITLRRGETLRLFTRLFSLLLDGPDSPPGVEEKLAAKARLLVEEHLTGGVRVGEIASSLGVTREHLSRTFAAVTGQTLKEYIADKQVARACLLLKHTALPVGEIAQSLAFGSCESFIAFFHRRVGMTPLRYRRDGAFPV